MLLTTNMGVCKKKIKIKNPKGEKKTLEMTSTLIDHKHESKLRSMRFHYHPISFPTAELEMGSRWIMSLAIPADPREP